MQDWEQVPGQGRLGLGRGNCGFFPAELVAHLPRFSLRANGETPVWSLQPEGLEPDKKWNFLSRLQSMRGSHRWETLREEAKGTGMAGLGAQRAAGAAGCTSGPAEEGAQACRGNALHGQSSDHRGAFLGQAMPWEIGREREGINYPRNWGSE